MWQVRKKTAETAAGGEAARSTEDLRIVTVGDAGAFANRDSHTELKVELHQQLLDLINLQALEPACVGGLFADMVINIASLDPVLGDVDK